MEVLEHQILLRILSGVLRGPHALRTEVSVLRIPERSPPRLLSAVASKSDSVVENGTAVL
jgi:hypothetical protein